MCCILYPIGDRGQPKPEFLFEHNIAADNIPHEWFEPFLPRHLTSQWTLFTNHKALLLNAGREGGIHLDFKTFINDELRKHTGIYMVHGLLPSPQVSMKFSSQKQDDMNVNNFLKDTLVQL